MSDNLVGTKLGNYRLERLLGRGRMGVVYLARDEALLRPTAVKILSWSIPESDGQNPEAWFIAEARNVARVNHPHVVQIYSVARHGAYCYIAMEYVEGATADVLIERNGPFSVEQATELLIQTSGALQAAHDANVVHRDIKPENLLVGRDGKAKLGDFGMALHTAKSSEVNVGRVGTPYYTAPEIWRGDSASASSDIYALGATYFYLLTGRPPFVAKELQELIFAHVNAEIPEIPNAADGIALGCQDILRRCMAKSPYRRFPSAQAVGWEARALLRRLASVPPPPASTPKPTNSEQSAQPMPAYLAAYASPEVKSITFTDDDWRSFFGFLRDPFTPCEPGKVPYQGEPFASLLVDLEERVYSVSGAIVLLIGPHGIGRTTLAQELLAQQRASGLSAHISCSGLGPTQTIAKKALRAFGVSGNVQHGASPDLDSLIEYCLTEHGNRITPLLVVDDCDCAEDSLEELASLALAAHLTDCFRLLLLAGPDFEARLLRSPTVADKVTWQTLHLSVFRASEVAQYIERWLRHTLDQNAEPLLFTPDALLILTHRSQGIALRINRFVTSMLMAAAVQQRRVLDSWDAWAAPLEPSTAPQAARPEQWPTPEVLRILNHCRNEAGMQPRR